MVGLKKRFLFPHLERKKIRGKGLLLWVKSVPQRSIPLLGRGPSLFAEGAFPSWENIKFSIAGSRDGLLGKKERKGRSSRQWKDSIIEARFGGIPPFPLINMGAISFLTFSGVISSSS